ncbi:hypothetical protein GF406_27300 [candidate division KSB1 bacterium]|nr:hypothetical protein [candidate division KSB1 bacterium]
MAIEYPLQNKNLPEPIYKRAVVAAGFSPRLTAILNESHRLLKILGTWPIIVNVGEDNPANKHRLEEAIERSNFRDHPPIFMIRSGPAADVLMDVAKEYHADLIVAGALKKEGLFKYYFGSVARNLARNAPCSVMLFTEPQVKPDELKKIHCAVEYDNEAHMAVQVATNIAYYSGAQELYLTHTFRTSDLDENQAKEIRKIYADEDNKLKEFLSQFDFSGINHHTRSLHDSNRQSTLSFTRDIDADLLVVASSRDRLGLWDRLFPHDLELALQNLPCSLLLTRPSQT